MIRQRYPATQANSSLSPLSRFTMTVGAGVVFGVLYGYSYAVQMYRANVCDAASDEAHCDAAHCDAAVRGAFGWPYGQEGSSE